MGVSPLNPIGDLPVLDDAYVLGGYHTVTDSAARDAIPSERRRAGMLVWVENDTTAYRLGAGLTNGDWSIQAGSSDILPILDEPLIAYTFQLSDVGARRRFTGPSLISATVPPESAVAWQSGQVIYGVQFGDGAVAILEGSGVTIRYPATLAPQSLEKYAQFSLIYEGSDVWTLGGLLAPAGTPPPPPVGALYGGSGWSMTDYLQSSIGAGVAGNSGTIWAAILFSTTAIPTNGTGWFGSYFSGAGLGSGWGLIQENANLSIINIMGQSSPLYTLLPGDLNKYQLFVGQYDGVALRSYFARTEVGSGTVAPYAPTDPGQRFAFGNRSAGNGPVAPEITIYGLACGDASLSLGEVEVLFDNVKLAGDIVAVSGKTDALYSVTQDRIDANFPNGLLDKIGSADIPFDPGTFSAITLQNPGLTYGW